MPTLPSQKLAAFKEKKLQEKISALEKKIQQHHESELYRALADLCIESKNASFYQKGIESYERSFSLAKTTSFRSEIATAFFHLNEYPLSLKYWLLTIKKDKANPHHYIQAATCIYQYYYELDNYHAQRQKTFQKISKKIQKASSIAKEHLDADGLYDFYYHVHEFYYGISRQQVFTKSNPYNQEALLYGEKAFQIDNRSQTLHKRLTKQKSDHDKSFNFILGT